MHIERPCNRRSFRAVDPVRKIHGLEDEAIALAERRIGWFKFRAEVLNLAVEAADAVEVLKQPDIRAVVLTRRLNGRGVGGADGRELADAGRCRSGAPGQLTGAALLGGYA